MQKARGAILALVAALATALFYGRALWFDLQCDDLLMIRPWSRAELFAVWHGTWEPGGAFAVFFRPVATWFYAATFELFGLNAPAHMLLSLAMLAVVMWLLALFITRESGSIWAGALAVLIYAVHPNVPWSTGTWVTNDFHKLTAISALCALLLWQRVRHRSWSHWLLLAPFAVICFLVKEDGLMLIPALVSIQWVRAKLIGDVKAPAPALIASAGLLAIALFTWRYLALRELGGFDLPRGAGEVFHNLTRGPLYAFTWHGSLSVLTGVEKLVAVVILVILAMGVATMPRAQRFLPAAGIVLIFWYALPLSLISNVMRYYMLTIASVMVVVPVVSSFNTPDDRARRWPRFAGGVLMLLALWQRGAQGRELTLFAPCNWAEHNCVTWVLEEVKTLPPEARWYVQDTGKACAVRGSGRPHIGEAGTLTWGLGQTIVDTTTGNRSFAIPGDVVTLLAQKHFVRDASKAWLSVRHPGASAATPVRVELNAEGRRFTRELTTAEWTLIEVEMAGGVRQWLRGAHRIDTHFSTPGAEWQFLPGR